MSGGDALLVCVCVTASAADKQHTSCQATRRVRCCNDLYEADASHMRAPLHLSSSKTETWTCCGEVRCEGYTQPAGRTISSAISSAAVRTVAIATSVGTMYQPVAKDPMTSPASRPTAIDSTSVARGTPAAEA